MVDFRPDTPQGEPEEYFKDLTPRLWLSRMANGQHYLGDWVTNEDVAKDIDHLIEDPDTKVIFFSVALCDYTGNVWSSPLGSPVPTPSGKSQPRLKTSEGPQTLILTPAEKILGRIRKERKDIFLVAFKTTAGATPQEQYEAGLSLLKRNSCNLVLANDLHTRLNMVIVPELGRYYETTDRRVALEGLIRMASARHTGTFSRTSIEEGPLLPWGEAPETLRRVVEHCIQRGAYRPFNDITVGHFGYTTPYPNSFLYSSRRKRNFNKPEDRDLVKVMFREDGDPIAYGGKPSAGARSQHLVLSKHYPIYDCILHFHCPLKPGSTVNVRPQHDFECGSLECGVNTREGLQVRHLDGVAAVMLDQHGPNILFHHNTRPEHIIAFIEANFDLTKRTGDDP